MEDKLLYRDEVYAIQGAVFEVYVDALADEHRRQILNYLRITHSRLGLLINFGAYPRVAKRELEKEKDSAVWEAKNEQLRRIGLRTITNAQED